MLPLPPPPEPPESTGERPRPRPAPPKPPEQDPEAFPREWLAFLKSNVFHYQLLSKAERTRLRNDTQALIARKDWEGCGGLSVTDEMKVTIAAQACLMLLGQEHDYFGHVRTILIYPSSFQASDERWQDEGWLPEAAGGQAVYRGPVILAWDTVLAEGRDPSLGANLVIHEFAHQLDFVDGYADGTLDLQGEHAERWQEVLNTAYNQLRREIRQGRETFLGDYAATSKTEFFATASERFFTQPAKLRHFHPALYQVLSATYAVEPESWFEGNE
ncbi:MAG: zinc-dependent peptidase [Gemmataceae bacterium]|nr:zinc-dependent peptidase [Gemmataceae bacterium]